MRDARQVAGKRIGRRAPGSAAVAGLGRRHRLGTRNGRIGARNISTTRWGARRNGRCFGGRCRQDGQCLGARPGEIVGAAGLRGQAFALDPDGGVIRKIGGAAAAPVAALGQSQDHGAHRNTVADIVGKHLERLLGGVDGLLAREKGDDGGWEGGWRRGGEDDGGGEATGAAGIGVFLFGALVSSSTPWISAAAYHRAID